MAYEYDYRNLLVRLIRAGGRTGEPESYTYDFSKITSYTYTSEGRVSTTTDRNGAVTVCVYDIHGNHLSKTVTDIVRPNSVLTDSMTPSYTPHINCPRFFAPRSLWRRSYP